MEPGKLELAGAWLPTRPWYTGDGKPLLEKAGGYRLDDPAGEVGIEFMVVADTSGDTPVAYHLPVSYRGAPLDGAQDALIGTSEHGVLGRRWVYDGAHDPVVLERLVALVQGRAVPQAQSDSDTPDPTVSAESAGGPREPFVAGGPAPVVADGPDGTDVTLFLGSGAGSDRRRAVLHLARVLRPGPADGPAGSVTTGWRLPGGATPRGVFATLRDA